MVKLKKEISMEEAPMMLQRRHTIVEDDKDSNLPEPKLKSITRSSSSCNLKQVKNNYSEETCRSKQGGATLSTKGSISISNASTVVITDSELSSSWIYSGKKAQIQTSPVASNFKSSSRLAEMNEMMSSPMLRKSNKTTKDMTNKQTSSYCCNVLIVLIIGVAALGILAAIASIYYIEYFASYNATNIQKNTKRISQDIIPLKKVGHSLGEENRKISELPGKTSEENFDFSTEGSEKVISTVKPSFESVAESKIGLIVNDTDSSSMLVGDLLNLTSQMINSVTSDQKENLNQINELFFKNPNLESHYGKLFESYQGLRSVDNKEKSIESEPYELSETTGATNINNSNSKQVLEDENANEEKVNFDAPSADDEIPFQLDKLLTTVEEDVTEDVTEDLNDEIIEDSSIISEDNKDLSGASDDIRDLSTTEDKSTDVSIADEDSPHFRLNTNEDENIKDFPNMPLSNLSTNLEFQQKNITELNQKFSELETLPDGLVTETSSLKPLTSLSEEDNLETLSLFRTLDFDFEEDKNHQEQSTDSDIQGNSEFRQKNITELNQKVIELETLPDGLENIETSSLKPLPSLPEEENLDTVSFRALDVGFEGDKNREEQFTDSDEPLANLPIVGTANRSRFIPNFLSRLDRTWGFSNFLRNPGEKLLSEEQISVSADDTGSVDLNLPIIETDIAVPRPVEMSKRFGILNNGKNDKSDLTQQGKQFSLERALDGNNILPS